jgi:hypothetical protein
VLEIGVEEDKDQEKEDKELKEMRPTTQQESRRRIAR